jgi:hypothetical protein
MGELADRLDNIHLHVRIPGTEIEADLRDRNNVTISFGDGGYEFLNERNLEHYLATIARLLYVGWVREYRVAIEGTAIVIPEPETQADRDYIAARSEMEVTGASADGRVEISAIGMRDPQVRIARGTVRELSEAEFLARTKEAVEALTEDYQTKIRALKVRFFT